MNVNVGTVDRAARILIGLALIIGAVTGSIGAWGWIGILPLASGVVRFCPAYQLFGLSTCETRRG